MSLDPIQDAIDRAMAELDKVPASELLGAFDTPQAEVRAVFQRLVDEITGAPATPPTYLREARLVIDRVKASLARKRTKTLAGVDYLDDFRLSDLQALIAAAELYAQVGQALYNAGRIDERHATLSPYVCMTCRRSVPENVPCPYCSSELELLRELLDSAAVTHVARWRGEWRLTVGRDCIIADADLVAAIRKAAIHVLPRAGSDAKP